MPEQLDSIIDEIYEAAAFPERWPKVMDRVSMFAGAAGGSLHVVSGDSTFRRASERLDPLLARWVEEGWHHHTFWHERALAFQEPRFYGVLDLCTPEELERDPMYNGFFAPRGYGWSVGSVFRPGPEELVRLNIQYRADHGPVGKAQMKRLDRLRNHLGRAAMMVVRTERRTPQIGVAALDVLGIPAAIISRKGRVLAYNCNFERVSSHILIRAHDRVVFRHRQAEALFQAALTRASLASSIPIPATDHGDAAIAHLVPTSGDARDIFGADTAIMMVSTSEPAETAPVQLIRSLFDLTPAEARLAAALLRGQSLTEIAQTTEISRHTLKTQLASIFAKTNTSRQAQLVSLVSNTLRLHRKIGG
jgi:DNA-binding CsgD family transcriptional regulator